MKWTFIALFLSPAASAADLYCDARFPGGPEGQQVAIVVSIGEDGQAHIPSSKGPLDGKLRVTQSAYRGMVYSRDGEEFNVEISRYDGSFAVFPSATSGRIQSVVWGDCRPARQMF